MADKSIRVSSTAWTGLPAERPLLPPKPKRRPSNLELLISSVLVMCLGAYGTWQAISTGAVSCRGCRTFTQAEDPVQFGIGVLVLFLCVPFGLAGLCLGIRSAWRKET